MNRTVQKQWFMISPISIKGADYACQLGLSLVCLESFWCTWYLSFLFKILIAWRSKRRVLRLQISNVIWLHCAQTQNTQCIFLPMMLSPTDSHITLKNYKCTIGWITFWSSILIPKIWVIINIAWPSVIPIYVRNTCLH